MEKLIILQKQLNSCEWEIVCSSKDVEVINKAKAELRTKNIRYKLSHYKGTPILHPYRITFINLSDNDVEVRISINISNCLENEKVKTEDVVIRKKEVSFTVYLWASNEDKAYFWYWVAIIDAAKRRNINVEDLFLEKAMQSRREVALEREIASYNKSVLFKILRKLRIFKI